MYITKQEVIKRSKGQKDKELEKYLNLSDGEVDKKILEGILAGLYHYRQEGEKPDGTYVKLLEKLERLLKDRGGIDSEEYREIFETGEYTDPEQDGCGADAKGDERRCHERGKDSDTDGGDK